MNNKMDIAYSLAVEVSGTILIIISLSNAYHIARFLLEQKYKQAQFWCMIILTIPSVMGWSFWLLFSGLASSITIEPVLGQYKSIVLLSFLKYSEALLGWDSREDQSFFSRKTMVRRLASLGQLGGVLKYFRCGHVSSKKKARKVLKLLHMTVLQFPILTTLMNFITVFMIEDQSSQYIHMFIIIRSLSSILAIFSLANFVLSIRLLPNMHGICTFSKFLFVQASTLLSLFQPLILSLFSKYGMLPHTNEFSVPGFINGLLISFEVTALAALQFHIFPVSDYRTNPTKRIHKFRKHCLADGVYLKMSNS